MTIFNHAAYGEHKRKTQTPVQTEQFCEHLVRRGNDTQRCGHILTADGECANASAHLS